MGVAKAVYQSGGQLIQTVRPGGYSIIVSVQGSAGLSAAKNVVIMGQCMGGQPDTLLQFSNAAQAISTLKSGALMDAVRLAFNPGNNVTPALISAVRVNSATQSSLTLNNGSAQAMITIQSADYGLLTQQINLVIAAGTTQGQKLTVNYQTSQEVFDNIYRGSLTITHATATVAVTINNTTQQIVLSVAPGGTIDLNNYPTIGSLAAYINSLTGYTATVSAGQTNASSLQLDSITATAATAGLLLTSNMYAMISTINSQSQLITATAANAANNTSAVANITTTFLTGGTEGTYTGTDWTNALSFLAGKTVQIIATPDATQSVQLAIAAHCTAMSAPTGKKERQFIVGGAWGDSSTTALSNALAINSQYGMYVFNGGTQYDIYSNLQNYGASYAACMLAGMDSALAINMPLTFKTLNFISLEATIQDPLISNLISGGVAPIDYNESGVARLERQITTYQTDDLKWNEFSSATEMLYVDYDLRSYLQNLYTGQPGIFTPGAIQGVVETRLQLYVDLGLFVKDTAGNTFWNVSITILADQIIVDYDANICMPINFQFITNRFHTAVSTTQQQAA